MKCKLTRIISVHENLRTDEVVGFCDREPMVGQEFHMVSTKPLDPTMHVRLVSTTQVLERNPLRNGHIVIDFKTINSDYKWEFLGHQMIEGREPL